MREVAEVALGEVAEFVRGVTFKPDDVTPPGAPDTVVCMRTKNVQGTLDTSDVLSVPRSVVKRSAQYLKAGDTLVSSANSWNLVGKCCWVPAAERPLTFGGFISVLRADPSLVDQRYLYRWFSSPRIQQVVRTFGRRTTSISNLDLQRCRKLPFPLSPLDEQRRIARVLDGADALRARRRGAIENFAQLQKAAFLEVFGDPITNPKGWPMGALASLGELDRGVSKHRPRNSPHLLGGPYPLVQTGDVARAGGRIRGWSSTYSEAGITQSRMWPAGTLCITIAANIAHAAILDFDACFPDSVVGFVADAATTQYVRVWLSLRRSSIEASASESAQKNINLRILRGMQLPIPPASVRDPFLVTVSMLERIYDVQRAQAAHLDALFASLQHRAFAGEV